MKSTLVLTLVPLMLSAANYSIEARKADSTDVYVLRDAEHRTEVWVAPGFGNNAYDMRVNGQKVLWAPDRPLGEIIAKPTLLGNPFLWPWANRIDQTAYFVDGKKYQINTALGNIRLDANQQPIHGLIMYSNLWKPVQATADADGAVLKSRLEYWRYPELMEQFPFAHTVEMTYRLSKGVLEVETSIENHAAGAIPVSLGFHPYFQITDAPRDDWRVTLPARQRVRLTEKLVPSGETEANPYGTPFGLKGIVLDDVFSGLTRGADGFAVFSVEGKQQKIAVEYGPKYLVAVVYAPAGRDFICFEPMSGVTNAFNAAHAGWYKDLQTIPAGGSWKETYRIRPAGY